MPQLTKLGKYDIARELGKGAMGIVYEGFDPFIERTVAIKTILKPMLDSTEAKDMLNRFRREAQAAGRLTHPNIVSVYEYGEDQDMAFIAMEFIHGRELKKYFDNNERFHMKDIVRLMAQLLDALEYSHNHGVVHRDIKPSNIIITEEGQVKVADFGIAKIESSHLTQAGTVLGTPTHMSPEQFMGIAVDRRSDIYSSREGQHGRCNKTVQRFRQCRLRLAMKKLGDIYGVVNDAVPRDYVASIKWYNKARQAGVTIDASIKR